MTNEEKCTHHWTVTSECPFCLRAQLADAVKQRDADRAELCNLQIAFNDWKVVHSTARIEEELAAALEANSMLIKAASDMEEQRDAARAENKRLLGLLWIVRDRTDEALGLILDDALSREEE